MGNEQQKESTMRNGKQSPKKNVRLFQRKQKRDTSFSVISNQPFLTIPTTDGEGCNQGHRDTTNNSISDSSNQSHLTDQKIAGEKKEIKSCSASPNQSRLMDKKVAGEKKEIDLIELSSSDETAASNYSSKKNTVTTSTTSSIDSSASNDASMSEASEDIWTADFDDDGKSEQREPSVSKLADEIIYSQAVEKSTPVVANLVESDPTESMKMRKESAFTVSTTVKKTADTRSPSPAAQSPPTDSITLRKEPASIVSTNVKKTVDTKSPLPAAPSPPTDSIIIRKESASTVSTNVKKTVSPLPAAQSPPTESIKMRKGSASTVSTTVKKTVDTRSPYPAAQSPPTDSLKLRQESASTVSTTVKKTVDTRSPLPVAPSPPTESIKMRKESTSTVFTTVKKNVATKSPLPAAQSPPTDSLKLRKESASTVSTTVKKTVDTRLPLPTAQSPSTDSLTLRKESASTVSTTVKKTVDTRLPLPTAQSPLTDSIKMRKESASTVSTTVKKTINTRSPLPAAQSPPTGSIKMRKGSASTVSTTVKKTVDTRSPPQVAQSPPSDSLRQGAENVSLIRKNSVRTMGVMKATSYAHTPTKRTKRGRQSKSIRWSKKIQMKDIKFKVDPDTDTGPRVMSISEITGCRLYLEATERNKRLALRREKHHKHEPKLILKSTARPSPLVPNEDIRSNSNVIQTDEIKTNPDDDNSIGRPKKSISEIAGCRLYVKAMERNKRLKLRREQYLKHEPKLILESTAQSSQFLPNVDPDDNNNPGRERRSASEIAGCRLYKKAMLRKSKLALLIEKGLKHEPESDLETTVRIPCKRRKPLRLENRGMDIDNASPLCDSSKVNVFQRLYIMSEPMQKMGRVRRKKILEACAKTKVWFSSTRNITIADHIGMM